MGWTGCLRIVCKDFPQHPEKTAHDPHRTLGVNRAVGLRLGAM
jgi:hypothetical protein